LLHKKRKANSDKLLPVGGSFFLVKNTDTFKTDFSICEIKIVAKKMAGVSTRQFKSQLFTVFPFAKRNIL